MKEFKPQNNLWLMKNDAIDQWDLQEMVATPTLLITLQSQMLFSEHCGSHRL